MVAQTTPLTPRRTLRPAHPAGPQGAGYRYAALIAIMTALLLAAFNLAADEVLQAQVDRTSIHQNETLTLTVTGEMALELNLGSLMNLRNLSLPEPDLGTLADQFEILDKHQAYSIRSINGNSSAEVTWTYQLLPRRSGTLEIPSISFKDARSAPITVEVKPGPAPLPPGQERAAWVEAEVDKSEVFVQEQLVYTLRLYYRGGLMGGDLTEPELKNAIIEPLGEQQQYSRMIDGQRYQVVERQYVVYPQRSGELILPSQRFTGRLRDPATGNLRFLRAQSEPITVEVKPPPQDFPGDRWVPAESLVLNEEWSRDPNNIQVGDNLTRVLKLRTLGLLPSALPRLEVTYPENFNAYPEPPESEAEVNSGTIEASQSQTTALVAVKPGTVELPAIELHWWDTLNDQARVAKIPARTLTIKPAPGADSGTPPPASSPEPSTQSTNSAEPATVEDRDNAQQESINPWIAGAAVAFALAWLATMLLWARSRRSGNDSAAPTRQPIATVDLATLKSLAVNGDVRLLRQLPLWVRERFQRPDIHSMADVRNYFNDKELDGLLTDLERCLYSDGQQGTWNKGTELAATLERLDRQHATSHTTASPLPPFRR